MGDKESVFLQQDAAPCSAPLSRWRVVLRISWSNAASGSTPAYRIVRLAPRSRARVAMRPLIPQRTLPVTQPGGHKSSDASSHGFSGHPACQSQMKFSPVQQGVTESTLNIKIQVSSFRKHCLVVHFEWRSPSPKVRSSNVHKRIESQLFLNQLQ